VVICFLVCFCDGCKSSFRCLSVPTTLFLLTLCCVSTWQINHSLIHSNHSDNTSERHNKANNSIKSAAVQELIVTCHCQTRLPSNLRPTTRECVHLVTRGHFRSRDKDDTIRSAISENPMVHANFTLCVIEAELLSIVGLHSENRDFRHFLLL